MRDTRKTLHFIFIKKKKKERIRIELSQKKTYLTGLSKASTEKFVNRDPVLLLSAPFVAFSLVVGPPPLATSSSSASSLFLSGIFELAGERGEDKLE